MKTIKLMGNRAIVDYEKVDVVYIGEQNKRHCVMAMMNTGHQVVLSAFAKETEADKELHEIKIALIGASNDDMSSDDFEAAIDASVLVME